MFKRWPGGEARTWRGRVDMAYGGRHGGHRSGRGERGGRRRGKGASRLTPPVRASLPIFPGLAAAFRFLPVGWRSAWAAIFVASGAIGAFLISAGSVTAPVWRTAWFGAAVLGLTMARGALLGSALARGGLGEHPSARPAGLGWERRETRLLAGCLLSSLFLCILASLVFVAWLCAAYAVASAGSNFVAAAPSTWADAVESRGRAVLGAVAAAGVGFLSWAALRLAFAPAATVARGRVQALSAWPLTRGVVARLLVAQGLAAAGPALLAAALARFLMSGPPAPWPPAACFGLGLVAAGLWLPLNAGLMAFLFRRLDPATSDP